MPSNTSNGGGGWLIDYGGVVEDVRASDFLWAPQIVDDPSASGAMLGFEVLQNDNTLNNVPSKKRLCYHSLSFHTHLLYMLYITKYLDGWNKIFLKHLKRAISFTCCRNRVESCAAPGTKACREKMRRDKLNDKFTELCSIMEPGKPPKTDKFSILNDATRLLTQLRNEAKKLKESNEALQVSIKNLKAEKLELRDEKVRLKGDKERIEQMLKATSTGPQFVSQPAVAALHAASVAAYSKTMPHPNYLPMGMLQWIPPAALDTSQDHVLRPPVA